MKGNAKKSLYQDLVKDFLFAAGMKRKLKGYYFIVYGITEILYDYKQSADIMKKIACTCKVKDSIVHDNIRYMIHVSWKEMDHQLKMMFDDMPSPKVFLVGVSEKLRKDSRYKEITFSI